MATNSLQGALNSYRSIYLGYEAGLCFDAIARQIPIDDILRFNVQDGAHSIDTETVKRELRKIFGKQFSEFQGGWYGFVFYGAKKSLFSIGSELLGAPEFQAATCKLLGTNEYEHLKAIFKFIRNFWIHNNHYEFQIENSNFASQQKYVLKRENEVIFPNGVAHFIAPKNLPFPCGKLEIKIDFKGLKTGTQIQDLVDFPTMTNLLRFFYNLCSVCEDRLAKQK